VRDRLDRSLPYVRWTHQALIPVVRREADGSKTILGEVVKTRTPKIHRTAIPGRCRMAAHYSQSWIVSTPSKPGPRPQRPPPPPLRPRRRAPHPGGGLLLLLLRGPDEERPPLPRGRPTHRGGAGGPPPPAERPASSTRRRRAACRSRSGRSLSTRRR